MRRRLALLGALAGGLFTAPARAQDASPPPDLRAELARQGAAIQALQASLAAEKDARLHPAVRVSGFTQIDWVVHNEASQNEISGSTLQPLNQDRFNLRRGHIRLDAEEGLVLGS